MVPRFAVIAPAIVALALVAAACGATPTAPASSAVPASQPPVAEAPDPTPVLSPVASPVAAPVTPPDATPDTMPVTGQVDGARGGPELSIEQVDEDTIIASLDDPEAKAWRLVVAGLGDRADDRWEIVVETGDVAPVITATEIQGGQVTDVMDLSGYWDGTAAAGGCHATLPVCLDSEGFIVPDGDGHFSVRLDLPQAEVPLLVRGGAAAWDGEPFILGPWHDTEAFPWGEG